MKDDAINKIDEENIEWKEFTSKDGKKFEVGFPKGEASDEAAFAPAPTKSNFGICLNWIVGDCGWKQTAGNVQATASITSYALCPNTGAWKYILYFVNTQHYNYYFYDQTGDYYQVNTFRNGSHYVRYNSDKPTIVFVTGS